MPGGAAGGTGAVGAGRAAVASHGYGSPSLDTWLRTSLHFRTTRGNSLQLDATTLARPKHTTQLLADTAVPFFRLPPAPRRRTARVQLESPSHRTLKAVSHLQFVFHLAFLLSLAPETCLLKLPSTKIKRIKFQVAWV